MSRERASEFGGFVAGVLMELRLGAALLAADDKIDLQVDWTFVGDLASTWKIDFLTSCVDRVAGPHCESPIRVEWALSAQQAVAHLRGLYGFAQAHRKGELTVAGARHDVVRFSRAIDAVCRADLVGFRMNRDLFFARRIARAIQPTRQQRRPTTGVRLRSDPPPVRRTRGRENEF